MELENLTFEFGLYGCQMVEFISTSKVI